MKKIGKLVVQFNVFTDGVLTRTYVENGRIVYCNAAGEHFVNFCGHKAKLRMDSDGALNCDSFVSTIKIVFAEDALVGALKAKA